MSTSDYVENVASRKDRLTDLQIALQALQRSPPQTFRPIWHDIVLLLLVVSLLLIVIVIIIVINIPFIADIRRPNRPSPGLGEETREKPRPGA